MPSEAQSQEPRDRGPAPPITRAGRSAQRAKATATSSTPERRTRGRPRKDGSGSRSAPPAPPPPPPSPKSRKKGRSRGRAQGEDEESVVGTQKNPLQGTDMKEKTTGRRRSTSRRKPNTNPQPSQDCLSPEPEPDPDPTVPESTPEPSPRAEKEDRTSPAPAAPLPASSPRVSSLDCDPGHSPPSSPRPAPDPVEEDRPSPSHSPVSMEVVCDPSTVPMDITGGGTSPIERSPALSPCSSTLVSPCPRLEDEDSLSPGFQRCLSEDSGGSPTPSLGLTKKRLKQCAFCYRGDDEPPLGQGRLVVFGPTPGYIPLHILNRRASSDRDNDCHDHCYRGNQAPSMCSSPEQCESSSEFVEQLGPIGLPHDINVQSLFDPTGQCCAHLQCAAWSEGVCRGEGQSLLYVDKAIDSGSTQVCAFCHRLGASLRCQETSCGRSYHFPCAAATGAQQDWTQRHTLCTRHTHAASSQCVLCSAGGDVSGLLMCCCCGDCYHSSCLDPPLTPSPLCRAGWQCPQCRVCQSCRLQGDDGMLLVCERCDKAYHTHCLSPPLDPTPSAGWNCKNCRLCRRCGVRSSGQWANHPFLCESCDPALPCPLCDRTPDLFTPQDHVTCICCYRCVHTECVVQAGEGWAGPEDYVCSTCRIQEEELVPHSPTLFLPLSPVQAPTIGISQLQVPDHAKPPLSSHSGHSPVQPIFSEPPQSPTRTISTPLQEDLQHSPGPPHPEPTELQHNPEPHEPELIELQHSPKPPRPQPTEYNHSCAPPHSEPPEVQHSSVTPQPETTELQHSPEPPHPQPTELQNSPEPSQPEHKEPQHSPEPLYPNLTQLPHSHAPPHPETTALQRSPAPTEPEPAELQHSPEPPHPQPTELQHSPTLAQPEPTEFQHSPEPSQPEHKEPQHSPEPPDPDLTKLQHSPEGFHPEPAKNHHSPATPRSELRNIPHSPGRPQPKHSKLQHSPAPLHPDETKLQHSPIPPHIDHSETQHSPTTPHAGPTERQRSPTPPHIDHSETQHSPTAPHPDPTERQRSPTPPHIDHSEAQHSPTAPHPNPTERQCSPTPPHIDQPEHQHSPTTPHPDPTERQRSPTPPHIDHSETQRSPEPPHTDSTEPQRSPEPPHTDSTEPQRSPEPLHIDSTEPQHSPATPHPNSTELQRSPEPPHPDSTELHRSPEPPHPDSTELQRSPEPPHPDSTELQHSPEPPHPDSTELQRSPEPPHPDSTELQRSLEPPHPDSTELQRGPEPPYPDPTELRASPTPSQSEHTEPQHSSSLPHTDSTEFQHSPAPSQSEPTELQHNPLPLQPDSTEVQLKAAVPQPDHRALQQGPALPHSESSEFQHCSAPAHLDPTELHHSPAPPYAESTEAQQSPAPSQQDPVEFPQSPPPSHIKPMKLETSPLPSQLDTPELQQSHVPSHSDPVELQEKLASLNPDPTDQKSPTPSHWSLTGLPQSPTICHSGPTELQESSSVLQRSPIPVTLTQIQHSPHQLNYTSCSPTSNSTEDQLMSSELKQSPMQGSPISCSHGHCSHSPTQTEMNPSQVQPGPSEPWQRSPPHSLVSDYLIKTQVVGPFISNITKPQHIPSQIQHSPLPHSPAQVGTLHPQSPTQNSKPTLDQESPGTSKPVQLRCGPAQDISTLDLDLLPVCCKSTQTARRCASLKPVSAPCSPSPAPARATQYSLSQPASPVQVHSSRPVRPSHFTLLSSQLAQFAATKEYRETSTPEINSCTQVRPNHDRETLESSAPLSPTFNMPSVPSSCHDTDDKLQDQFSPVQSSALSLDHSSPLHVPPMLTPDSLVHIGTSTEHSSLICSPSANETENIPPPASHIHPSPCHSPLRCAEANDIIQNSSAGSSPQHASQVPTSPTSSPLASASPMPIEPIPALTEQPSGPLAPPLKSSVQPASPLAVLDSPIHPISCRIKETEEAVFVKSEASPGHPNSTPDSLDHASPAHTEAQSGHTLMGSVQAQETASSPVCSFTELSQTQTSQSSHPDQSSPSHVQSTCSPLQTSPVHRSPLPSPTSFSPLHCRLIDTSPPSCSASHSLSHGGQTTSGSSRITDVSIIHSPPRPSHAGQASPVHAQSTSCSAHSGQAPRQTPSLQSMTHCSPVHGPPHTHAQAGEPYCSTNSSPAPDSSTSSGPDVTSLSLDVDMIAGSLVQGSVLSDVVHLMSGTVKTSPPPASSLRDDVSAVGPNQASQINQTPPSPLHIPDKSAVENQQSTAPGNPLYQRPATPADGTSIPAPHDSPVHSSPTQDNDAMPITGHTSETSIIPHLSVPSQDRPYTLSPRGPQASSVHSCPVASPVCVPLQTDDAKVSPTPVCNSPVKPRASTSPDRPMSCEASPCPIPFSPSQLDAGPGSPQQATQTEATAVICMAEEEPEEGRVTEREDAQQEGLAGTTERPDEEEPVEAGEDKDQEEDQFTSSGCPAAGVLHEHRGPPPPTDAPLLSQPAPPSPQPIARHSALPPPQSSSSSTSPRSPPPSPSRAGSLDTPPFSPQRTALLSLCPPHTLPSPSPPGLCAQEKDRTSPRPGETGADDDSQVEPVGVGTELAKDTNQSQTRPSETEEEPPERPEPTVSCVAASPQVISRPVIERQYAEEEQEGVRGKSDEEKVEEAQEGTEQEDQSEVEEEPVSPVLELDPSLDIEVMELMSSSSPPPSLLHLSSPSPPPFSRRGKGRTLRPPPVTSRPSDDLSIRLRQSPFSTEASPETSPARTPVTPPPLSPPSPPLRSSPTARESPPLSKAPPSTVLLFTPKIGMGKPAISKRKFSPGRARIKQGSWWSNRRAVSPPSSSQDSMGEGGWDSPKPRPLDSPLWSMRVGRGSGFPGRRRSRGGGVGGGRGARGRSRLKTQESLTVSPGSVYIEPFQPKEEEENSMHNTVVMFSTSDHFTLKQDMCVVCGSFGQGAEGRLLACSQCGQCYHPYCVGVKITRVVLTKGWRCLECTVCEACGEASDPGRLLLCDDCDISYHTYCLDPPLHTVPKGAWKCKWCVWCVHCGSSSPGLHCDWQSNYSRCGPCDSLSQCPLCGRAYTQDDLILQCQQCDRWVHAVCQGLTTEDEVEVAADEGFDCSLCRNHGRSSHGRSDSFESPFMAQIISRIREPDSKTYTQDGVSLTESGLSHLQSLVEPLMSPRRYRRCKPKLKLRIINQNSVSVLQTPGGPDPSAGQDSRGVIECDMRSDSSPERDHAHCDDITKEPEVTDGNKKRKRKPYRPGIGGFMVRQRGGKAGPSRIKLCRKDSSETLPGGDQYVPAEMAPPADPTLEKVKKRYRKKKTKLEEAFPSYLQEAFFGRDLLDRSQQVDRRPGSETPGASQPGAPTEDMKGPTPRLHGSSAMATNAVKKQGTLPLFDGALLDLCDVLNTEPHILAAGHTGQSQVERSPSPFAGLHISSMADNPSLTGSGGRGQRAVQEEPLDAILSPELDKMVTDGAILSKFYKIPELEGKDVEEVFTAVLSPNSSTSQPEQSQHTHPAAGSKTSSHHTAAPRLPVMNGLMGAAPRFQNAPVTPSAAPGSAGFRLPLQQAPGRAPLPAPAPRQAVASQGSATGEGEQDGMSTAQRSMLKWEKEETLGEMATVAPVLYCNTNFPQLREQYPDWSTRVKQIAKLWRKASSQDRAPFVQKARDNRAAQRINKVQLSNDPLKRHQPSPLPGPYDPVSMETDGAFRDPLRPKESEQEQEWKLRQQMRQKSKQQAKMEASQKLEQVKNEQLLQQRQQQLLAVQRLAGPLSPETGSRSPVTPVALGNASPLHPPASREGQSRQHLLLQGSQSSGQADDVFLRPQAPPPSGFSSLPHSPLPSSPLHQPPSSPQMFSPPSSRPSSPWDPYNKMAGTPRPTSQATGLPAPQQQRRNSLSTSPAHDAFGSPAPSPDSKTSDRAFIPQTGLQQSRTGMITPPSGSTPDLLGRHVRTQTGSNMRVTVLELSGRAGELVQGGLFKTPMPPQHQPQTEGFGSTGARRDSSRPTDLNFGLPQSQDPAFPSSPLSGLGSPHRSPYAQTPGTPRPDYSQQITDPFTQQSPPYVNPQTPGTPRPHSDPTYLATPSALRLDQYTQQSASCRPSPSHQNMDPFSSNPGTPRPPVSERLPRSPGSQRSSDAHTQSAGAPRPSPDPYTQQPPSLRPQKAPEAFSQAPVESYAPQSAGSGSSPLAPGDTVTFTASHHQLQPSPGQQQKQQQQDSFPRTPSSQTAKHPGMVEESSFSGLAGQAPAQDPFEQGHVTPGPSQMDKTTTNEMAALAVASLDGSMSMMPQLGDSEEKLRQRQRLRQLILRQQQQKTALRQEKGLQEGAAAPPAAPPGPPHHWSQADSSTTPPTDPFGRPPPPYPGTVRPVGTAGAPALRFPGGFPGEQQRDFNPNEAPVPRRDLPREQGVRGPVLRFAALPAGLQDSFLRPPQGPVPGSGLGAGEGVPVQMKRPGEFTGIRPLPAAGGHLMPGVPQPFLPRSLPLQQHNIMGQPYIELRHRAPENRLRLPPPSIPEPEPSLARPGLGQQMAIDQQHVGPSAALTQSSESALPGADGIEEHLEDSAVKDLEDVEVKDLVDLNLNLDPEDGKEDLDLGPNDLHLDDLLLSGKFDLIAYADPELNLEDKKDMFNEELDLGEPMEEKESGARKADFQVKQETRDSASVAQQPPPQPALVTSSRTPRPPGAEAGGSSQRGSSAVLAKVPDSDSGSGALPAPQNQDQAPTSGMVPRVHPPMAGGQQSVFQQQQRPFGPSTPQSALFTPQLHCVLGTPQGPPTTLQQMSLQPSQPRLLLNAQTQPPHPGTSPQSADKHRPLLLEEQPLLLQDLLDQERQEQQQQKQMQALIRQRSTPESGIPNMNFDSITDPIMKAKMVALKGINKVMTQGNLGLNPMVINRFQQAPVAQVVPVAPGPEGPQLLGQDGKLTPQLVRPSPPSFGPGFANEAQRRQYEEWLGETQQLLQMQQRLLEDKIAAHRKTKKSLSAKQRTAKKAGRAFAEEDAAQLRLVTEQQGTVQKQLEQIRKQQKDHSELIEDYRTKQQQQRALQQPPAAPPMMPQTLSQPMVPMQPHQGGPTPACVPNAPPAWAPGSGGPGVIVQRMAPQMPPALPNASQAPGHTQTPSAMVPGFTVGPRVPSVAAGDGAVAPRQVNFDDTNPFSEGFQERERRERLREQQERQRVQLLQEVERHRALQQRLELEQQGLLGASMGPGLGVTAMPPSGAPSEARVGPGGPAGSAPAPGGDSLSQMPFFSSELPQDFLQSPPVSRPPPLNQGQTGAPFPQHAGLHQGFTGGPQHPAPGLLPGATAERGRALSEHGLPINAGPSDLQTRPRFSGPAGSHSQEQVQPAGVGAAGMTLPHRFGHDSSSSSPSTTFPPSFPCSLSGPPPSLIQLYSDIIPDDKAKKKRSRKRDGDDTAGGDRTPMSSHSDDITAPPTPAVSDTSCSTPTRGSVDQSDASFSLNSSLCGLAPSSELEKQLCVISAAQQRGSVLGVESVRGPLSAPRLEVKEEREEGGVCGGDMVKTEESVGEEPSSPSSLPGGGKDGDGGKELLRHLLKDKISPGPTLSPTSQAPPTARRQLSSDSVRSEEEDRPGSHGNMENSQDLLDSSDRRKTQRCKRLARLDKDRAPPKHKRRKREEEDKTLSSASSDPLTHVTQLSVLPLMEPVLGVDLSLFPPYGSASLGRESRLTGSFGNASLDGVTDFYSQLIYKNNLSNPPTPPASLPPTPPPVARQKLVNGFATTEELSRKDLVEPDGVKQKGEGLVVLNHASKTVDVPASLPTPPHNNQEELRVQESSESPDGYVPSSSPESVADTEVSRYPDLSFIKLEPPSPCPSPTLPIMPSAWGKASAVKQEVKLEPTHRGHPSCSNTDLVTIAITLNPVAAQNVAGVMAAVAELLRVPVPGDYQLSRPAGPERSSLALLAGVRVPLTQGSAGSRQQRPPPAAGSAGVRTDYIQHGGSVAADAARPQVCSYCKELVKGVHVVKQEGQSRPGPSPVFCSPDCSARHSSDLQSRAAGNKDAAVLTGSERPPPGRVQHQYTNNMSSIAVHSLLHTPSSPPPASSSPPLSFPPASSITMETKPRTDSLKVKVKLKPHPRAVPGVEDSPSSRHLKRMKCCRWRRWSVSIMLSRGPCIPNEAVAMPTEDEVDVLLAKFGACLRPDPLPKDQRRCCFCNQQGDGQTDGPARLLNLDLDLWVHLNCALWSSEVYETQAGALINVELALRRGLTLRCAHCQQTGATSGCNRLRCTNTYHFTCALQAHCTFFKDKTMLCHLHKPRMVPLSGDRSSSCSPSSTPGPTPDPAAMVASDPYDSELRCFAVFRRVFVQRDEARQIAALVQRGERQHTFRVGSLLFRSIGRLLPQQMNAFHNKTAIFPIGYHANRIYWSMRHSSRRCKYMCYIEEQEGHPMFKVKVVEKGYDDHILTGATPKAVWDQILEPVSQLRSSSGTLKLFPVYLKGEDLFGLTTSAVTRIMESLPGVESCERYTFRYGRNPLMEWPLAFNPSGSARSEPKACQSKRPNLLTSVAPRCQGTVGSIVGLVPGVVSLSPGESVAGAHQGRHSKSSQYRRMKAEWKTNVYLARSRIQGLGLYAARDIEKCTMVIEYIGTIIRSEVANRKERLYESQNRGVYMFRIDNDYVIDATITGGPARYINHSCSPNCITEVVTVEKENKIIISSCRRIQRGEELSYDYKFDLEDDQHKIPCHCGAVNCRKWMN